MAYVVCDVSKGLRDSERTVAVRDLAGRRQFLRVEHDFRTKADGKWYLPVGVVHVSIKGKQVLIELPHEADSGANRLWVGTESLLEPVEAPA